MCFWMGNVPGINLVYNLWWSVESVGSYKEWKQVTEIGHFGFLWIFCFLLVCLGWNLVSICYRDRGTLILKNFSDQDSHGDILGTAFFKVRLHVTPHQFKIQTPDQKIWIPREKLPLEPDFQASSIKLEKSIFFAKIKKNKKNHSGQLDGTAHCFGRG